MLTHYEILEVSESASEEEIKAAFKKKAVLFHPDKNPDIPEMEERFKEVNRAYQVLSNPYEKARYDLALKYGVYQQIFEPTPDPPAPKRQTFRPNYAEPEINYKANWIATAYAFGFTFIVAIIVMIAIGIKGYYDEQLLEKKMTVRRASFENAVDLHSHGKLDSAFHVINSLGGFSPSEEDMYNFKKFAINDLIQKGEYHYTRSEFMDALFYLELLDKHADIPQVVFKEWQAHAYREIQQPTKSIQVLTQLLILGYRTLSTYVEMAEIYRDQLNDPESAKNYFIRANEAAKEQYKAFYGEAYLVVLSASHLPEIHYRLYSGLADIYLQTNEPAKAVDATRWNIRVWPDRPEAYLIAALGHQQLGEIDEACMKYKRARQLGSLRVLNLDCP